MPYFIETFDKDNHGEVRAKNRPDHLEYLRAQAKLLLACGAKMDDEGAQAIGSVYLVDVDTRAEAEAFLAGDPFSKVDLFESVRMTRWRKAVLNGEVFF